MSWTKTLPEIITLAIALIRRLLARLDRKAKAHNEREEEISEGVTASDPTILHRTTRRKL